MEHTDRQAYLARVQATILRTNNAIAQSRRAIDAARCTFGNSAELIARVRSGTVSVDPEHADAFHEG